MLKNWTITFKGIKKSKGGFSAYLKYLGNNNHKNHIKENHKIINFKEHEANKVMVENQRILDQMNYKKILNGKGGRPSTSYGISAVISFPFKVSSEEKLKKFKDELIKEYYKDLCRMNKVSANMESFKRYKKLIFCNIHIKDKGSQTQINLILPHYLPHTKKELEKHLWKDKEIHKQHILKIDMSQKKYSFLLKTVNNQVTKSILGIDNLEYIPIETKKGKRKKLNEIYKQQNEDLKAQNEQLEENIKIMKEQIQQFDKRVNHINRQIQIFEQAKIDDKTIKKYRNRFENALRNGDLDKTKENLERMENRSKKVINYNSKKLAIADYFIRLTGKKTYHSLTKSPILQTTSSNPFTSA